MTREREPVKGLVTKWAIRPHSSADAAAECHRLRAEKVEYAQDEEGRIWRRIHRRSAKYGWRSQNYMEVVRWHIADMYDWFPGADPQTISGARPQNTRACVPKKFDVYLVDGRILIDANKACTTPSTL